MTSLIFPSGQLAMLLLAAGSIRGTRILSPSSPFPYQILCRLTGASCLVLSLFLQIHETNTPIIALITWIGLLGPETLLATLTLTILNNATHAKERQHQTEPPQQTGCSSPCDPAPP